MKRDGPEDEHGGPPQKRPRGRSPGRGETAFGRIVNWYPVKKYGFIQSNVAAKDVFFPRQALPPELQEVEFERLKGMEVSFIFTENEGKPRAEAVTPVSQRQNRLPTPPRRREREGRPMEAPPPQERLPVVKIGVIRSYDTKKGFGFIKPDDMQEDAFYLRSELPPELAGGEPRREQVVDKRVEFEVRVMPDGKVRAERIVFLWGPGPPGPPPAPMAPMAPMAPLPGPFREGRIRNFYPSKGYGFIEVPMGPDVFFLPSALPKDLLDSRQPLEGLEISFEPSTSEEGKPRARNIRPIGHRGGPPNQRPPPRMPIPAPPAMVLQPPPPVPMGHPAGPPPVVPMPPPRQVPEPRVAVGIVTSYDAAKGFGFLKVEGIRGDVFFARSDLPPDLREEDKKEKVIHKVIEFELQKKSDGKLRARKLLFLHRNLEGVGQRTRGRVAKYHQDKGYGFLECEYGDNVFFLRSSLPKDLNEAGFEELSQLEISFQIYFKEQGKPRAQNLEIVGRERREERPQLQGGEVLIGEIVTFEPVKGFGFVRSESCDEDVYFLRPELPEELAAAERKEEVVGERVEFEVKIMTDGKLRAQQMSRLFPDGDSAPSRGAEPAEPAELSELEDDMVQDMADYLAECGNGQDYGKFTNRFPRVKKRKIERHFDILTDEGGRQRVVLPPDHPQRVEEPLPDSLVGEAEAKEEERREDDIPEDDLPDEAEESRPDGMMVEEVDPNEPAIPLGPGVQPVGVIRDYDTVKGFGFIRCEHNPEDIFFPRTALPKSFQGSDDKEMPVLKGVQVTFELNESNSRGPRSDSVTLLLRWLQPDRCWLLKRVTIPPRPARNR